MSAADSSFRLDRIDRQLLHALLIDGRASFSLVAEAIGTSEQTVARRYRRLREAGVVRVFALPAATEGFEWIVRIGVRPGAASRLAAALAERDDVSWVRIMAGGAEVCCISQPSSHSERDALLLERLARTHPVAGVTAHAIMRTFIGRGTVWAAFDDPLEPAQADALRPAAVAEPASGGEADVRPEDAALLALLRDDGRASFAQLGAAAGISPARARRRLEALTASGQAYVHTDVATELLGFPTAASLWLSVAPGDLEQVGDRLAALEQTTFVAAVTGPSNLTASVVCANATELYRLLTDEVGMIDAVRAAEVSPVMRRVKQAGSALHGTRLRL